MVSYFAYKHRLATDYHVQIFYMPLAFLTSLQPLLAHLSRRTKLKLEWEVNTLEDET